MLDHNILKKIESIIQARISETEMIGGGDTGSSYKLYSSAQNSTFFFKLLEHPKALENIASEVDNLKRIGASNSCEIPPVVSQVHTDNKNGLLLEWIERKIPDDKDLSNFGQCIARLHLNHDKQFGWHQSNYISVVEQVNGRHASWSEFYLTQRIEPLLKKGIDRGIFPGHVGYNLERLESTWNDTIPNEKPSFLHGDLWGGNFIIANNRHAYLIDPACYFGHREMDLAMSLLFGSFGRTFYQAYQEVYPLEKGFEERIEWHQLYPLMVHALLFQGHYIQRVINILQKI